MSKPEKVFKIGAVRASIFQNTAMRDGKPILFAKVVLEVRYRDKMGNWKGTNRRFTVGKKKEAVKVREAACDALEAQEREDSGRDFALLSFLRNGDVDSGVIRGLVDTPIYPRPSSEHVAGDSGENFLCRVVDILHELAQATFGRTRK
jgi:hypothetical protein